MREVRTGQQCSYQPITGNTEYTQNKSIHLLTCTQAELSQVSPALTFTQSPFTIQTCKPASP